MCRTQNGEPHYDYSTTTTHSEYLHTTEYNPTTPNILVGPQPEPQTSTQPTLERGYDVPDPQLALEPLGEQERAYICSEAFREDDILARLGLDLSTEAQAGDSSLTLGLNIVPQLCEPPAPSLPFSLCGATAQASTEFDAISYMAQLDVPLPTSTGWEQDPQLPLHANGVFDTSFIVPHTTPWSSWPEIPANEGLNGQGSATTGLNALSPGTLFSTLSQQLLHGLQEHTTDPSFTSLQPPQPGRPRARTAPTVFRDVAPNAPLSYPPVSPIPIPPATPRSLFSSEGGSSTSSSPFSQSRDLPSYGNPSTSNFNPRFRSASVSTVSRGRPLTRPRRMVERVLDPARVRQHLPVHTDISQYPTSNGLSPTSQHLDVPLFEWHSGGSDASDWIPDSPSTPSNLSRASSMSSVNRRPRSRSRSNTPYPKSSGITAGDGITGKLGASSNSTEYTNPSKNRKRNGRDEFSGQRLHFDEKFMETILGDEPLLRKLLDNVLGSTWRKDHTMEPNYGSKNDDVSLGLDLPIERGTSVLLAFVRKIGDDDYTCVLCNGAVSARVPRQLGHVRGHIDLRPFPCKGCDSCDPKFPGRFFSRDLLKDHHRSSKSGECPYCGEKMRIHNLKRHTQTKHHQFTGGGVPYIMDVTTVGDYSIFPPSYPCVNGPSAKMSSSSKVHSKVPSSS